MQPATNNVFIAIFLIYSPFCKQRNINKKILINRLNIIYFIVFELNVLSINYGLYWYNYYIQLNQIGA